VQLLVARPQSPHPCSRPILVLSANVFNDRSGTVIGVVLTSREPKAGFPLTLESRAQGLTKRSWIKIGQIRTLSTERLGKRLATASEEEVDAVLEGLSEILGA
jgi:mRNA interferase MazF